MTSDGHTLVHTYTVYALHSYSFQAKLNVCLDPILHLSPKQLLAKKKYFMYSMQGTKKS